MNDLLQVKQGFFLSSSDCPFCDRLTDNLVKSVIDIVCLAS